MLAGTATQSAAALPCRSVLLFDSAFTFSVGVFFNRLVRGFLYFRRCSGIAVIQTGQQIVHRLLVWFFLVRRRQRIAGSQAAIDAEHPFALVGDRGRQFPEQVRIQVKPALDIILCRFHAGIFFLILSCNIDALRTWSLAAWVRYR